MYSIIVYYRTENTCVYAADREGLLDLVFILADSEHVTNFMVYSGETPLIPDNFGWVKMEKWIAPYKTVKIK